MKNLMVILAMSFFAFQSFAAESSDSSYNRYDNHFIGSIGYTKGGLGFGLEYEKPLTKGLGVGGVIRINPKNDDSGTMGLNFFGGFLRPHFHSRAWSLNFTMGAGLVQVKSTDDKTVLGTSFGTGIFYQVSKAFAMGVEQTNIYGWLQEDYPGVLAIDMLVKVRFGF